MRWVDGRSVLEEPETILDRERTRVVIEPVLTGWHLLITSLLLAIALWLWVSERLQAEAFPVRLILSYVPTVSTWGPSQATGVALITFSEGDVRADFVDLPVLDGGNRYALWLMRSKTKEAFLLGKFDAKELPVTHVDLLLPDPIPEDGWDMLLVTVEPEPDPDPGPDSRWVLVGALPGTPVELELMPPALPQTGEVRHDGATPPLVLANLMVLILLGLLRPWRPAPAEARRAR